MADTTKMPNPPAPPGGYQEGGWYQGRQAWQGSSGSWTFSQPEQINTLSNQQGAGGMVDKATQTASSIAQTGKPNAIQDYFDNYGKQIAADLKGVDLTGSNADNIIGATVNGATNGRPLPPNLETTYQNLSDKYGVSDLMKNLNDLNAKKRSIQQSVTNAASDTEAQTGVTADVVAGRESEQQRQADKQIAQVDLEIQAATDQLNAANSTIQMYMQFAETDYQNAASAYDTEFSQNLQMYDAITSRENKAQSIASANWQTAVNMVTSSGKSWNQLTPQQQAFINNQAVQAGIDPSLNGLIHGMYAPNVTQADVTKASAAPVKKTINPGFNMFGLNIGGNFQWQIYNPMTKQYETYQTQDEAAAAQSTYLQESTAPSSGSENMSGVGTVSSDGKSYWDGKEWVPVVQ